MWIFPIKYSKVLGGAGGEGGGGGKLHTSSRDFPSHGFSFILILIRRSKCFTANGVNAHILITLIEMQWNLHPSIVNTELVYYYYYGCYT